jgi:hypothetical protein
MLKLRYLHHTMRFCHACHQFGDDIPAVLRVTFAVTKEVLHFPTVKEICTLPDEKS